MTQIILIHYGEVGLKGKNQQDFINQLAENIRLKLKGLSLDWPVKIYHGYLTVEINNINSHPEFISGSNQILNQVQDDLKKIFGIAWLAKAVELSKNSQYESIENHIIELAKEKFKSDKTFAIAANRANKSFPLDSKELEIKLGKAVQDKTDWHEVDLDEPDQTFYVDIHQTGSQIYSDKTKGYDGLPVKSAGKVLSLLSGGLDSPIASWVMAKRGSQVDFIHFAATHMQLKEAKDYLISQIVAKLSEYTLHSKLFIVPYTHFNLALLDKKTDYELVLFRRFMMRVAEKLALQTESQAIVTGDNLSQVASQTMENLVSTTKAVTMPIFRPLIAYNKNDTIKLAREIDTFELSTQPYKDCCSLISEHPKTISHHEKLEAIEQKLLPNYEEIINYTLNDVVALEFKNGKLLK